MAFQYIGTLEQPKQEVNPYMQMLMQYGLRSKLGQQEIAGRKELATAQGEAAARAFLARKDLDRADKNTKWGRSILQSFWDKMGGDLEKAKNYQTSDEGKALLKTFKDTYPEGIDKDTGMLRVLPTTKDTIKQEVDSKIAEAKNILLTRGPDALTTGQTAALKMEGFTDEFADTMAGLYGNPQFLFLMEENPEKAQWMAQEALEQRATLRKSMQGGGVGVNELSSALGGGRQPLFYGPNAMFPGAGSTPISQEATPQKTRFKVRRLP